MKRVIRASQLNLQSSPIMASHIYVNDESIKKELASDMFEFMNEAYKWIGGFKSFTGEDDFADRSYLWYITYDGEAPSSMSELNINKVYTVSVYKQKFGLKMIGIGNNRFVNESKEDRKYLKAAARDAMKQHVKFAVKRGWTEVSGKMEDLLFANVPPKFIIEPEDLLEVPGYENIEILPDGLHYARKLSNGDDVVKMAWGTIRV